MKRPSSYYELAEAYLLLEAREKRRRDALRNEIKKLENQIQASHDAPLFDELAELYPDILDRAHMICEVSKHLSIIKTGQVWDDKSKRYVYVKGANVSRVGEVVCS
jgi:hypothetical protein